MPLIRRSRDPEKTVILDEQNGGDTLYIGEARLGSDESGAVWRIKRLDKTGTVTSIQYANGSRRFNQVWDNRSSVTYSN